MSETPKHYERITAHGYAVTVIVRLGDWLCELGALALDSLFV